MHYLKVRYKNKTTGDIYSRKYKYYGTLDKKSLHWLQDADEIAYTNCGLDEDVMGYDLVEEK